MPTLRIRGVYAAALSQLFHQTGSPWEIVQPDEEVQARLARNWRMTSPDIDFTDEPDDQGRRDTMRISGPAAGVEQVLYLLQQHFFDVITHQENSQIGAIYMGLVGLYSPSRRRAIVYMGNQQAGVLPLRYDERPQRVGSYLPVRIAAPPAEGDDRPQLNTSITVPGEYAVLTSTPGVRLSKQITASHHQERLQRLGEAQDIGGWGLIWRTAAQHADDQPLATEIQQLAQEARRLQKDLQAVTTVGYVRGGEIVARVYFPGHAKALCDALRMQLLPTLPGHHKYKAQGDMYGMTVDALEKELPPEVLHSRTMTLRLLSSVDAMQQPLQNRLRIVVRPLQGTLPEPERGELMAYNLDEGWVELRQVIPHREAYPAALRIDKQPGDYTITRYHEGSWSYIKRFYGRQDNWKGAYAALTMPIAIFSDQLHLVDLHVAVWRSATHAPQLIGLESLQQLHQQGLVTAALVHKVQAEGEALLQQFPPVET